MMKLRINPLVAKDLKSIKEFIAEDNADKALETVQEIYRQFENIQQFPYIGADLSKRVSFKTHQNNNGMAVHPYPVHPESLSYSLPHSQHNCSDKF